MSAAHDRFGHVQCPRCKRELPRMPEYFTRDRLGTRRTAVTCRACRQRWKHASAAARAWKDHDRRKAQTAARAGLSSRIEALRADLNRTFWARALTNVSIGMEWWRALAEAREWCDLGNLRQISAARSKPRCTTRRAA